MSPISPQNGIMAINANHGIKKVITPFHSHPFTGQSPFFLLNGYNWDIPHFQTQNGSFLRLLNRLQGSGFALPWGRLVLIVLEVARRLPNQAVYGIKMILTNKGIGFWNIHMRSQAIWDLIWKEFEVFTIWNDNHRETNWDLRMWYGDVIVYPLVDSYSGDVICMDLIKQTHVKMGQKMGVLIK